MPENKSWLKAGCPGGQTGTNPGLIHGCPLGGSLSGERNSSGGHGIFTLPFLLFQKAGMRKSILAFFHLIPRAKKPLPEGSGHKAQLKFFTGQDTREVQWARPFPLPRCTAAETTIST